MTFSSPIIPIDQSSANDGRDTRNLIDKYKNMPVAHIKADLDTNYHELEIAIENLERDFNIGSIVRTANAFNVRAVHIIGRRQWNRRGAMCTEKYLHVYYHGSVNEFREAVKAKSIIAVDNIAGSQPIHKINIPTNTVLVFGSEQSGVSEELLAVSQVTVMIQQFGSTRSINVGAAAAIAMYEWLRQNTLTK